MCNLHQAQRLQTKKNFNPWIDHPSLLNASLFLSFQTIQKRHKGVACHAFFLFFPMEKACHPNKASLTEEGSTHKIPKRENKRCHKTLVLTWWRRMWSTNSSSLRQRKHPFAKYHPLLWMWSIVRTFLQVASQIKKTTLDRIYEFQITLVGKTLWLPGPNTLYKDLKEKAPSLHSIHKISSSLALDTLLQCNLKRKCSMFSISQSLIRLEKQGALHPPSEE